MWSSFAVLSQRTVRKLNFKVREFLPLLATFYIFTCFVTSACYAQQTESSAPAPKMERLLVNWFYGAYVPKEVPLTSMSLKEREQLYERQTFTTPGIYLRSGFLALIDQAEDNPQEWGSEMGGYGKRFASVYGRYLIQNSVSTTGNAILKYEPRYDRCHCSGLWPRTRHALMRNFLTYNETEKELRPQFALYGGAFASGMISSTWKPRSEVLEQGYQGMLTQAEFGLVANWIGEFAPDILRVLERKRTHRSGNNP
jgi:hypothetical protein